MQYSTHDRCIVRDGEKLLRVSIITDENGNRAIQPTEADALIREIANALNAPESEKYNGWTNRETWALKSHLDNTEGSQAWLREIALLAGENAEPSEVWTLEQAKLYTTEDAIKDAVETAFERALNFAQATDSRQRPSVFFDVECGYGIGILDPSDVLRMIADVGSLWRVNWREIAKHVLEEITE